MVLGGDEADGSAAVCDRGGNRAPCPILRQQIIEDGGFICSLLKLTPGKDVGVVLGESPDGVVTPAGCFPKCARGLVVTL